MADDATTNDDTSNAPEGDVESTTQPQGDQPTGDEGTEANDSQDRSGDDTANPEGEGDGDGSEGDESDDKADPDKPGDEDADKKADPEEEARKERARQEYEQRKNRKAERDGLNAKTQEWIDQGETDEEKRIRRVEASQFLSEVETNQSTINNDHARATAEIDLFRQTNSDGTPNPKFNQKAYDRALVHLSPHLVTEKVKDPSTGEEKTVVLGTNVSVYQFLKEEAEAYGDLVASGAAEGQRAEQDMRARSETPGSPGGRPADQKEDPFLAGFNRRRKQG